MKNHSSAPQQKPGATPKIRLFEEVAEFATFLPRFLKSPREAVLSLPHWGVGGVVVFQIIFSAIAGLICGALTRSLTGLLLNTLFFPIQTLLLGWLIAFTLELGFRWWIDKKIEFKKLFVLVLICQVPVVLIRIFSAFDLPIDFIGLGAMAYLLYVAIPAHFPITPKEAGRVVGLFFGLLLVLWSITVVMHLKDELRFQRSVATAESQLFPHKTASELIYFFRKSL